MLHRFKRVAVLQSTNIILLLYDSRMHLVRRMAIAQKANVIPRTIWVYQAHSFSTNLITKSSASKVEKDEKQEKPAEFDKESKEEIPKLLRIPRATLEAHTYMYSPAVHESLAFHNKLFRLVLRPIKANLMAEINNGPNWLRGDYPMGLLKGVQERRRYVDPDGKLPSGWRELEGVDAKEDDLEREEFDEKNGNVHLSYRQSSLIKRPLLANGKLNNNTSIEHTPLHDCIPVLVVVGKKSIDNRAVIRNKVKTKLLFAFQEGLKEGQSSSLIKQIKWPLADSYGNPFALIFFPSKQILQEPMVSVIQSCKATIESIAKRIHNNPTFLSSQLNTLNNKTHQSLFRSRAGRKTIQNQTNRPDR